MKRRRLMSVLGVMLVVNLVLMEVVVAAAKVMSIYLVLIICAMGV